MSSIKSLHASVSGAPSVDKTIAKFAKLLDEPNKSFQSRIDSKVLHLNGLQPRSARASGNTSKSFSASRLPCAKFAGISNKSLKRNGFVNVRVDVQYETALQLHALWFEYAQNLICQAKNTMQLVRTMASCDLQGARAKIVASTCTPIMGLQGIIVLETQNTFVLVQNNDKNSVILKRGTKFELEVGDHRMQLWGNSLLGTGPNKSKRKIKPIANL